MRHQLNFVIGRFPRSFAFAFCDSLGINGVMLGHIRYAYVWACGRLHTAGRWHARQMTSRNTSVVQWPQGIRKNCKRSAFICFVVNNVGICDQEARAEDT